MKNNKNHIKKTTLTAIFIFMAVSIACLTQTASANISLVKPQDVSSATSQISSEIPSTIEETSKGRAPEPASIALFGSGFLGMIFSFLRKTYGVAKRTFDLCMSTIGMIIFAPFFILIALAVRLTSKGPILYKQIRVGREGELFEMLKFRTMKVDAEKETGPVWAMKNDNRTTPIGIFLRKSHLDELPQFINVLRGEMSLIGPRPERPVFVEKFKAIIPDYEKRLQVKPGITGLAQVWHRYDESITDVKKKVKYDLLYIKKMCFWADINIILRTVRVMITGEGAR